VGFVFSCVVFCLDFDPFFPFLLFPCHAFFLYLFIYYWLHTNVGWVGIFKFWLVRIELKSYLVFRT
jgi:hypothetical protein